MAFAQESSTPFVSKNQPESVSIRVLLNWHPQFEAAGFYAAQMLGLYQKEGLDVSISPWNQRSIVSEVVSGRYQVGVDSSLILKDFLQGQPIQVLMANYQFSPLVLLAHSPIHSLQDLNGKRLYSAHNYEIENLIRRAGVHPIVTINSAQLSDFISGKADFYAAFETNEPFQLKEKGVPFYLIDPKDYGVQSYADLVFMSQHFIGQHPQAAFKFKQATIEGWRYALQHPEAVVDYMLAHAAVVKSKRALMAEARASEKFIAPYGLKRIGEVSEAKLSAIVDDMKRMGILSAFEASTWQHKQAAFIFNDQVFQTLSEAEQHYLLNHESLKMAALAHFPPISFLDEQGRWQGVAIAYFNEVAKKLGVSVEYVPAATHQQLRALTSSGQVQGVVGVIPWKKTESRLNLGLSYYSFPLVVMSQTGHYVPDFKLLAAKRVAVPSHSGAEAYLKTVLPVEQIVEVDDFKQAVTELSKGQVDAVFGPLPVLNYVLNQQGVASAHIIASTPQELQMSPGMLKSEPSFLKNLVIKAQSEVSEGTLQKILQHWSEVKVVRSVDRRELVWVVSIASIIVIGLLLGMYLLQKVKRQQQAYIQQINELSYAMTVALDEQLTILEVANSYAKLIGMTPEEMKGKPLLSVSKPINLKAEEIVEIQARLKRGQSWKGEIQLLWPDGSVHWQAVAYEPIFNKKGEVEKVFSTRREITAQKLLEEMAIKDELTQLFNRRYFNEVFGKELNRARREGVPFSFVMLDIDFFKQVNDTYGHLKGDEVLKRIADVLKQFFHRSSDAVFRLGGEEFGILTYLSGEALYAHLEVLRKAIYDLNIENKNVPLGRVTISIGGVSIQPNTKWSEGEIYAKADQALYRAKKAGRNRVERGGDVSDESSILTDGIA